MHTKWVRPSSGSGGFLSATFEKLPTGYKLKCFTFVNNIRFHVFWNRHGIGPCQLRCHLPYNLAKPDCTNTIVGSKTVRNTKFSIQRWQNMDSMDNRFKRSHVFLPGHWRARAVLDRTGQCHHLIYLQHAKLSNRSHHPLYGCWQLGTDN